MTDHTMTNCIRTLLINGNGSHTLDLERIAFHQRFDPDDFRAAFLAAETTARMKPAAEITDE